MPPPASIQTDKNDLFAQYQILEDLGDFPSYSLFKVKAPNGTIKLWKKVDLQFNAASIETRLLPVIERVTHPYLNTVSASFLFQDKGLLFVESEFPAKTLRHRLEEIRSNAGGIGSIGIPLSELFGYMVQVAEGIDFLNTAQHPYQGKKIAIYHRALSPDSLHLFEEKGKIVCKVGDFGLAKPIVDNNEAARHSLGLTNYDYAPPEFDEGLTTSTSDQYSLATTYCELRTGKLPFTGSLLQKLQAQLSGNPDLSALEPNERPIVARALNRDPQARFPTCRDFVRQLQLALGAVVSFPASAPAPAPSGTKGKPAAAAVAPAAIDPAAPGGALFGGGGNSGWALNARPIGRSGGALFNITGKGQGNPPAKEEPPVKSPASTILAATTPAPPPPTPKIAPTPKAPEIKPLTPRAPSPAQPEGWSLETARDKSPSTPPPSAAPTGGNWTPGKVTAGPTVPEGSSNPDINITPPPPQAPARAESMSSKARETLELIKRKQGGQVPPLPPKVEKPLPGAKFMEISSEPFSTLAQGTAHRSAARTTGGKPPGVVGETAASPRPTNNPVQARSSTHNMAVPLPSRNQPAQPVVSRSLSPVDLARRDSAGQIAPPPPRQSSSDLFEANRSISAESRSDRLSWVTLLMVSIAAFCIGMMILVYLTKK